MADLVKVVILDDHALFYQALVAWLEANEPDIEVAYAGEDWNRALAVAPDCDVVLLDLDLGRARHGGGSRPCRRLEQRDCRHRRWRVERRHGL